MARTPEIKRDSPVYPPETVLRDEKQLKNQPAISYGLCFENIAVN